MKITYTHTDRPRASLFYGEERDINRNEQAFWWKNGRMVRCEEEENGEGGVCVARCAAFRWRGRFEMFDKEGREGVFG